MVSVGPRVATDTPASTAALSATVEEWFRTGRDPACVDAASALS
jgi:hypothetical protein